MSIAAIKGFSHNPQHLPQHQGPDIKALGGSGGANPELAAWYEDAYNYYAAVQNGSEPMPDQATWYNFLNQMNWAYQQLWGAQDYSSNWGDNIGGDQAFPESQDNYSDPFGGQIGPNGNIVYTDPKADIGFIGEDRVYDIFSYDVTLHVAPTSGKVTVTKVTDSNTQPPSEVYKIIVEDEAMGTKSTYIIHNVEDLENLKIMAANPDQVNVTFEDDRISVGEFQEGDLADGGGIPENYELEGDTAYYDGMMGDGNWLSFHPPFGNIENHVIHGNADISVRASDKVYVQKNADGGYTLIVTDRDGNKTTLQVKPGFQVNLNAHPNNVTFVDSKGETVDPENPSDPQGDLTFGGAGAPPSIGEDLSDGPDTGVDGVPEGFENFTLNGEGYTEPETENPNPDHENWPPEFKDLLEELGIDWETEKVEISEELLEYIANGNFLPGSKLNELLDALIENSSALRDAVEAADGSDKASVWNILRNQLLDLLNAAFGEQFDQLEASDLPEGVELSNQEIAQYFKMGSALFKIEIEGGEIKITEVELDDVEGAGDAEEPQLDEESKDKMEEYQDILDGLATTLELSEEEMLELITEMSEGERKKLWKVLDKIENQNVTPGSSDEFLTDLYSVMLSLDSDLVQAMTAFAGQGSSDEARAYIRDRIINLLQVFYPGADVHAGDDNDDIIFYGDSWDIIKGKAGTVGDPLSWLMWWSKDSENP